MALTVLAAAAILVALGFAAARVAIDRAQAALPDPNHWSGSGSDIAPAVWCPDDATIRAFLDSISFEPPTDAEIEARIVAHLERLDLSRIDPS